MSTSQVITLNNQTYPVIPLSTLVNATQSVHKQTLRSELCKKGWAFLNNDVFPEFVDTNALYSGLKQYCALPQETKNSHRCQLFPYNRFGYFNTSRKEGFRFITGKHLQDFTFDSLLLPWKKISTQVEAFCKKTVQVNGSYLFNTTMDKFVSPLINGGPNGEYGLFDTVLYYPQDKFPKEFEKHESQVDEHADPALFSLSIGSTAPGLEMYDTPNKVWVPVPPKAFVIWCGYEAQRVSQNQVQPGFHRVRAINAERMTAWFEVSIEGQAPFDERYNSVKQIFGVLNNFKEAQLTDLADPKQTPPPNWNTPPTKSFAAATKPTIGLTPEHFSGIPISKSGLPSKVLTTPQPVVTTNKNANAVNVAPKLTKEHFTGIPMSKSGLPRKVTPSPTLSAKKNTKIAPILTKEHYTGIPMSKSGDNIDMDAFSDMNPFNNAPINNTNTVNNTFALDNEFNTGIPMSKSGLPRKIPAQQPTKAKQNISAPTLTKEHFTGIPMSKSMAPIIPSVDNPFYNGPVNPFGLNNEFNTGIPMSKAMIPPQIPTKQPSMQTSEHFTGIPMSKKANVPSPAMKKKK